MLKDKIHITDRQAFIEWKRKYILDLGIVREKSGDMLLCIWMIDSIINQH